MTSPVGDSSSRLSDGASAKTWRAGTLVYTATGLIVLFFWLLWGDFAWSVKERSVGAIVQLLLRKYHASDTLAGILIGSLPAVLSMIITPVISYKSDRHRGRWGRRIPFLALPTPLIVLGMAGLAFGPQIGAAMNALPGFRSIGSAHCILIFIAFSWTLFEVSCIAANAVFGALINDVVPVEMLGRFYGAFRALSLIAGMMIFYWVFGRAEEYFLWIFLGVAALYGGSFTLMCMKVREGRYPPPPAPANTGQKTLGFLKAAATYFRECFGMPYYWLFFITISLSSQMALPVNLFSVFYSKSLSMDNTAYGRCVALTYLCSLMLSYPLGVLADRYHPLRLGIIVQVLYALVCLWSAVFIHDARTFGVALVLNGVLNGTWLTVMASVQQRMLPRAEFAQFSSANALVTGILSTIIGAAVGMTLDYTNHAYRYTFLLSFILTAVCIVLGLLLYARFMALGGPGNYVAPRSC